MKEPDFDASSLEDPDTDAPEPQDAPEETPVEAERGDVSADSDTGTAEEENDPENSDGSTLERHEDEVLYVKRGSLRRRPKYGVFGVIGGLIGLIVAWYRASRAIPADQDYTRIDRPSCSWGSAYPWGSSSRSRSRCFSTAANSPQPQFMGR